MRRGPEPPRAVSPAVRPPGGGAAGFSQLCHGPRPLQPPTSARASPHGDPPPWGSGCPVHIRKTKTGLWRQSLPVSTPLPLPEARTPALTRAHGHSPGASLPPSQSPCPRRAHHPLPEPPGASSSFRLHPGSWDLAHLSSLTPRLPQPQTPHSPKFLPRGLQDTPDYFRPPVLCWSAQPLLSPRLM